MENPMDSGACKAAVHGVTKRGLNNNKTNTNKKKEKTMW